MMTDDCVRIADAALVPSSTPTVATGAVTIAEETTLFADRIRASTPMVVDSRAAHVIAPGGHPLAVIDITTRNGRVDRIEISRASAHIPIAVPSTTSRPAPAGDPI